MTIGFLHPCGQHGTAALRGGPAAPHGPGWCRGKL